MSTPGQPAGVTVRPARPAEAAALTALSMRSKAHWGYDADFMGLCAPVLAISPADIEAGGFFVAEDATGAVVGVVSVDREAGGDYELGRIFVDPPAVGRGIGDALFRAAVAWCREAGISGFTILADPNAAPFYERMGAVRTGEAPSDAIPGRTLPTYSYTVRPEPG